MEKARNNQVIGNAGLFYVCYATPDDEKKWERIGKGSE
jgi:hypothetical protein